MAIDQGSESLTLAVQERTWRLEIFTESGEDPVVRVHRETVRTGNDGTIVSRERGTVVERNFLSVAQQVFVIGGNEYTGAEIAGVVSAVADYWRAEDLAAAAETELEPAAEVQARINSLAADADAL